MFEDENEVLKCADCAVVIEDDGYQNTDGEAICINCADNYSTCCECNGLFEVEGTQYVEDVDDVVCERCIERYFTECICCAYWIRDSNTTETRDGQVCGTCLSDRYYYCEGCDEYVPEGDYFGGGYCYSCDDERSSDSEYIHDYSYKPKPIFRGNGPRYFGVELEVECLDVELDWTAGQTTEFFGGSDFVYLKEDGSINHGFEIVTHPWTLQVHREKWEGFDKQMFVRNLQSFETSTCGLHVHISRDSASKLTWAKFIAFVSDTDHRRITETIAMRSNSRWCEYHKKKVTSRELTEGHHGTAINAFNRDTIEVRIFKGMIKATSIIRAIEYCDSALNWCESASHSSLTYDSFFLWLRKRRKDYPNLWTFLEGKNLVPRVSKQAPSVPPEAALAAGEE